MLVLFSMPNAPSVKYNGFIYPSEEACEVAKYELMETYNNRPTEYKSINQIDALKKIFKRKKYPNSENLAKKCFSIPIDPTLNRKDISKIVKVLNIF